MALKWKDLSVSLSTICTRSFHVLITVGIASALLVKGTVLRRDLDSGNVIQPTLFIGVASFSLILYFAVASMDPGFVKRGDPDVEEIKLIVDDDDEDDDEDISLYEVKKMNFNDWNVEMNKSGFNSEKTRILGNEARHKSPTHCFNLEPNERCGLCGLQKPMRAKHCRECKHCVRRFDHHCPWITNCVGERNHKWFYTFLLVELTLLAWGLYISVTGYKHVTSDQNWFSENILLLLLDVLMGILTLVVGSLVCIHTYLILQNHTTWETMSRHRIAYLKGLGDINPFNLGICRNIFTFFCSMRPHDWKIVYSKTKLVASKSSSYANSDVDSEEEFCEIAVDET